MKSIFTYIDYRSYIRDFYAEKKKTARFSYREFSKMAGFSSPVFIKLVIEGKTNVSRSSITKLSKAMGLAREEREYLKKMVLFDQAATIDKKMMYLNEMKKFQGSIAIEMLSNDQFEYFSKWYHPIIKELLDISTFNGDYASLSAQIKPPITEVDARQSVELLQKLGVVYKADDGQFHATHKFLTTEGMSMGQLAIKNMQKTMALLGADAIDSVPRESRDISGVSISIASESIPRIRDEIQVCRRRIMEIAASDAPCDSVYRVNFHLFPVSTVIPKEHRKQNKKVKHDEQ